MENLKNIVSLDPKYLFDKMKIIILFNNKDYSKK